MSEPQQLHDAATAYLTTRPEFSAGYEAGLYDGITIGRRQVLEEQEADWQAAVAGVVA
ncbi:hypothetical protein GUJ16_13880, partial [Enterococcus hirae]|nr:hypothetical protein [Enterococcus hirae]